MLRKFLKWTKSLYQGLVEYILQVRVKCLSSEITIIIIIIIIIIIVIIIDQINILSQNSSGLWHGRNFRFEDLYDVE